MMELIIAVVLGLALGFGIAWLIIRKLPQIKIREINYVRLEQEEQEIQKLLDQRIEAHKEVDELKHCINLLSTQKDVLQNDVSHLANQRNDISASLEQSRKDAEITAQTFLKQQLALVYEQFDKATEEIAKKYQQDEADYKEQYTQALSEYVTYFTKQTQKIVEQYELVQATFDELQNNVNIAVEASKREEEKRQEKNFYRLVLPESDISEISQLRAVEPFLRDKEALNKVIWKVYYEKPYSDLVGRVVGPAIKTGIYKITNLANQMCYVGQAVNIADRWKQHIKRGIGAEAPTRNKLYPAMMSFGVENFTFEIIEECERDKLDAQEDYWQEFFHAKDFGYSIK